MNVLIDTSPLRDQNAGRGIGRYTYELLQALRTVGTQDHFYASTDPLPQSLDLVHYPFFDLFFLTLPFRKRAHTVVTIHDVTPLILAKHYPPGIRGTIKFLLQKMSLHGVSHIITDSNISKRDIIEKLHIHQEKISVVPLAASQDITRPAQSVIDNVRKKYEIPKYYALYVGDINYNKNIPFLIQAMKNVPKLTLVLVGKNMDDSTTREGRAIQKAIHSTDMSKRVKKITTVSGNAIEDLSALYAGATVYVQPSLYEGFGLPVLEAMQCKTPVVCSLGGSLPEVAGDAAIYFHPHDEDECVNAILKVVKQSPKQRQQMVQAGIDQALKYSWTRTAQETLAVYQRVVSK